MFKTQTRLKLVLFGCLLALMEGIAKVLLPTFPLTEILALQGTLIGGYLGVRTVNNVKGYGKGQNGYAD